MKHEDARPETDIENGAADGEGFLGRWSRRKTEARRGDTPEAEPASGEPAPAPSEPVAAVPPDAAEERGEVPLPDPESLDENSDVSAFLSPEVSEELRRLALRRLFGLPKFNLRDGLDDYDDDYRSFESLGEVLTADLRHRMENEAKRAAQRASEEPRQAATEQPRHEADTHKAGAEEGTAPLARTETGADDAAEENPES